MHLRTARAESKSHRPGPVSAWRARVRLGERASVAPAVPRVRQKLATWDLGLCRTRTGPGPGFRQAQAGLPARPERRHSMIAAAASCQCPPLPARPGGVRRAAGEFERVSASAPGPRHRDSDRRGRPLTGRLLASVL
jgi:hypothetical protein